MSMIKRPPTPRYLIGYRSIDPICHFTGLKEELDD